MDIFDNVDKLEILELVNKDIDMIRYEFNNKLNTSILSIRNEIDEIRKENEKIIKNSKIFSNTITMLQLVFFSVLLILNKH